LKKTTIGLHISLGNHANTIIRKSQVVAETIQERERED